MWTAARIKTPCEVTPSFGMASWRPASTVLALNAGFARNHSCPSLRGGETPVGDTSNNDVRTKQNSALSSQQIGVESATKSSLANARISPWRTFYRL